MGSGVGAVWAWPEEPAGWAATQGSQQTRGPGGSLCLVTCSLPTPVRLWPPSYRCCRQTPASSAIGAYLGSSDGAAKGRDGAKTHLIQSVSLCPSFGLLLLPSLFACSLSVSVSLCLCHSGSLCLPPQQAQLCHPAQTSFPSRALVSPSGPWGWGWGGLDSVVSKDL